MAVIFAIYTVKAYTVNVQTVKPDPLIRTTMTGTASSPTPLFVLNLRHKGTSTSVAQVRALAFPFGIVRQMTRVLMHHKCLLAHFTQIGHVSVEGTSLLFHVGGGSISHSLQLMPSKKLPSPA